MAIEPPITLMMSSLISQLFAAHPCRFESTCAANASWTSTRPRSFHSIPARRRVAHEENRGRSVGERRRVGGRDAAVAAIEDRLELGHLLERRVTADPVVVGDHAVARAGAGRKPRHDLPRDATVVGPPGRELVAPKRPAILRGA